MYRIDRNNFHTKPKHSTIQTPDQLSNFIFNILDSKISNGLIFDPCVGQGSLLKPFKAHDYSVLGVDINYQGFKPTIKKNYLAIKRGELPPIPPALVIMNPPFNIDEQTKHYITHSKRPLLPEIWLSKTIELFGINVPMVLFTPYGFRLNQSIGSSRWQKFILGYYPPIACIISLPKDVFNDVLFHSEVLLFNIKGLQAHYFYNPKDD